MHAGLTWQRDLYLFRHGGARCVGYKDPSIPNFCRPLTGHITVMGLIAFA